MTSPVTTQTTETTYRRLYIGLWALAGVLLAGLIVLGQPLAGVAAFAGCAIVAFGLFRRYDGPLFDERDESRQAAASKRTLAIMGISAAVVFPAATALWALDIIAWPVWLTPIAFFVAALGFLHVGSMLYERTQPA